MIFNKQNIEKKNKISAGCQFVHGVDHKINFLEFVKFYEADFELAAAGRSRPVAAESSSEALVLELLEEVTSVRQQIVVV